MKKLHTIFKVIVCLILVLLIGLIGGGYYLIRTPQGSQWLIEKALKYQTEANHVDLGVVSGNLYDGIVFEDMALSQIQRLPEDVVVKIQKLTATTRSLRFKSLSVTIENARIQLSHSDPIVVAGTLENGLLDVNIFSPGLRIEDVIPLIPEDFRKDIRDVKGTLKNLDVFVKGPPESPVIQAEVLIDSLEKKELSLQQSSVKVDIELKTVGVMRTVRPKGHITILDGDFSSHRTKVTLEESTVSLTELSLEPVLNIKGVSQVEKTKIKIRITGTPKKPDIELSSTPSHPKAKLLVMLATGKEWTGVSQAYDNQTMTPAMAKDFVDYFVFGGKGDGFAQKLGFSDVSFTYSEDKRGVGFKKEVNKVLEVGYEVEQSTATGQDPNTTQKVSGEVKLTEKLSLEAKKEFLDNTNATPDSQSDDSLMIKYKKSF